MLAGCYVSYFAKSFILMKVCRWFQEDDTSLNESDEYISVAGRMVSISSPNYDSCRFSPRLLTMHSRLMD
jgi:hypothetical protein